MEVNPEEKINKERQYVLRKIRENFLRTKKGSPLVYPVYHGVIGGSGPTAENEVRTLEKFEELEVIKILNRHDDSEDRELFQLETVEPKFDGLYAKYENSFKPLEGITTKEIQLPVRNVKIVGSNFHFGNGDNVARDKIKWQDKNVKDVPIWLKYLAAIATILAVILAVYVYFVPDGSMIFSSPIIQPETEHNIATSTLNISDILAKYNALDTNLEQRNFLEKYRDVKIYGRGTYKNIDKPSDRFLITINVSTGLVSCYTNGDLETEQKLNLLKIGQTINFTGTFTTSGTWGGGWTVYDCIVSK